jgi:hypothetical protein
MSENLFDRDGPESRNLHAEAFENQLAQMGETLGWSLVCRNVDVILKAGEPSRGIDTLWGVANPWQGVVDGWLMEGKRKKNKKRYTTTELRDEIQTLRDKVAGLRNNPRFYANDLINASHIRTLVGGMLAHRSEDFPEAKVRSTFRELDFQRNEEAGDPTRIAFLGPDTLIGIADCFNHVGRPRAFLWPPSAPHRQTHWADACPPEQLAVGLVIYEDVKGQTILWVRGDLAQRHMRGFGDLVYTLGVDIDVVAFTDLNDDDRRFLAHGWRGVAAAAEDRPSGRLPSTFVPLATQSTMKEFDQIWDASAA